MIDLEQRRAIRFPPYVAERLKRHELGTRPQRLNELVAPDTFDRQLAFTVRRTDLDLAGHVNNTSYIEWALEAVSDDVWDGCDLARLDVQFISECHHGQTIVSGCRQTAVQDGIDVGHQILRQDDGAETARARTLWKQRS
jgi:acyl-ACP thioesterase